MIDALEDSGASDGASDGDGDTDELESFGFRADDAAARAERLAAFERRAAAGAQRERLNEFECAICLEAFKGSACPGGRDRVACLPCGHAMFCAPCAAKFRRCPQGCDGFRGILKLYL